MLPDLKDYSFKELMRLKGHYEAHWSDWDISVQVRLWAIKRELEGRHG